MLHFILMKNSYSWTIAQSDKMKSYIEGICLLVKRCNLPSFHELLRTVKLKSQLITFRFDGPEFYAYCLRHIYVTQFVDTCCCVKSQFVQTSGS